jgi:competence protein ComEC
MEGSEWRCALENAAKENGTTVHYISKETLLTYNNGMTIRIIPPAAKTAISDDENDTSYVYYVEYGGFKTVFTGDMSSFAEKCLVDAGKAEKVDLLKVAHHGSKTSTSSKWISSVSPRYAVISVGENNTFALPNDEVLNTLKDTELYRTDYDGDIKFIVDKKGKVNIETFNRR